MGALRAAPRRFKIRTASRAVPGFEFEPQCRARRFKRGLRQTEQYGEHRVAFGGELQAPQFRVLDRAGPCEHRAAGFGAQRLLGRPQRFLRRAGW